MYLWAIVILVTGLLAGCSASNEDSAAKSESAAGNGAALSQEAGAAKNDSPGESEALGDAFANGKETGAETASGGGFASDTLPVTDGYNQKVIYSASLNMQVDELTTAAASLRNAIQLSGGYILQFQDTRHDGEIGSSYTIKVPAAGFMSFIDRVEQIKHRSFERKIAGKDVSEEYVDLASRLKARQLVEERLLSMMDQAVKADDLLKFSQQLGTVQEDIERIKGRIRYLDNNVAFSTVELRMYQTDQSIVQVGEGDPNLGTRLSEALSGSAKAVWEGVKLLLVVAAGALPVLVVLAVIAVPAVWLKRRWKRVNKPSAAKSEDEQQPPSP